MSYVCRKMLCSSIELISWNDTRAAKEKREIGGENGTQIHDVLNKNQSVSKNLLFFLTYDVDIFEYKMM